MKLLTIVGARPQFIKAAAVSRAIQKHNSEGRTPKITEILVHTGQHYDENMSAVFFRELEIPEPNMNLEIGSGAHGWQTGRMLIRIEEVLEAQKPDCVLVYGDSNSTLSGALAGAKRHIPIAHVEAGLRSFNRRMPEEHNRVLTDHLSDLLFCPTKTSVENLEHEGIEEGVHLVGDVMHDSVLHNMKLAEKRSGILEDLKVSPKSYALATIHRAENTDDHKCIESIFNAFNEIAETGLTVIIPLHPRTRRKIAELGLLNPQSARRNPRFLDPVSYLDMLLLEKQARVILTDSGGVQKEAYWFGVPCVTLRNETEWAETVESGWNVLVGSNPGRIIEAVMKAEPGSNNKQDLYDQGDAVYHIVKIFSSLK